MKKHIRFISIIVILCILFSANAYAVDYDSETDVFLSYTFGEDNVKQTVISSSDVLNESLISIGTVGAMVQNEEVAPATIIGSDGREKVSNSSVLPYSAICWIVTTWPNGGTTMGTGWLFNEYCLMTAGHCVYNNEYGGASVAIRVYPAKNGTSNPYGFVDSTGFTINSWWENNASEFHDYAIVELESNIGQECGYFGYACAGGSIGDNITVTGYPGDKFVSNNTVVESNICQWKMSGRLNAVTTRRLSYTIDTYSGQSGAPVYLTNSNIAIGVHNGANSLIENYATRIDENLYQLMQSY